jgi:hypothetical protein
LNGSLIEVSFDGSMSSWWPIQMQLEPPPCPGTSAASGERRHRRASLIAPPLLEQSTEAAHSFHSVRLIEPQPLYDRGQLIWNRPAPVRAEFPPRPIQQHDIVLDLNRQEPLVGRPHMQTPQGSDWGGDARGRTRNRRSLGAIDHVRDGGRNSPDL